MEQKIIEIQSVFKNYGKSIVPAVDGICLDVVKGEKLGVFGPNGAGKTTLISMMCGILKPTRGTINYTINENQFDAKTALKFIGYVPQDFAFYPELSAEQNLTYFGKMYGLNSQILIKKIDFLLEKLGLSAVRHKKLSTYSGGMKRRINLAIGILNDPKLLFLDEPTVGVDVQSKYAIDQLLDELNEKGTTIVFTSHHLKESEQFCDRIALIDKGKIIEIGTLQTLLSTYQVADLEELLIHLTGKELRD
ncbi:MAG: ABC transporter ATP-binding protein [Crocinitomicaceae bacterium]|nr:ABC transporter ATP-binding protein [Crocinitomicaceae bacterium]